MVSQNKILNIPTNLVTGFLGVGKTSAILHLMEQKPADEKWAVLVNEFGSIGIDGAIYKAKGIEVKEIPGGCMCCVAGLPLQVAINRILSETKPQRLLIEASGLGHPKRVLDTLQGEHFQQSLAMNASICLIDPRNLLDKRYLEHENFIDQIMLADVLVANKTDLCDAPTLQNFDDFASRLTPAKLKIIKTQMGRIDASLLSTKTDSSRQAQFPHFHEFKHHHTASDSAEKDGYNSIGWKFNKEVIFDYDGLTKFLEQFSTIRIKAIMHTNQGWMVFNIQNQEKDFFEIEAAQDSRLEILVATHNKPILDKAALEQQLNQCICSSPHGSKSKQ